MELTKLQHLSIHEKYSEKVYKRVEQMLNERGTNLNLNSCNVDDICAIALAKMLSHLTQLQQLSLHNNQIGDTGATALGNSITNLAQLQELYLDINQIGNIGATAIANSISDLANLTFLFLQNNNVSELCRQQFQEQFDDKLEF